MSFAPFLSSLVQSPLVQSIIDHEHEHEKEKEKEMEWLSWKTGLFAAFAANLAASLAVYGIINDRMKAIEGTQSTSLNANTALVHQLNDIRNELGVQVSSLEEQLQKLQNEYETIPTSDPSAISELMQKINEVEHYCINTRNELDENAVKQEDQHNDQIQMLQNELQVMKIKLQELQASDGEEFDPEIQNGS